MDIKEFVDRILADKVLTKAEHEELKRRIAEDGFIDVQENEQVDRIFELIEKGEITVE